MSQSILKFFHLCHIHGVCISEVQFMRRSVKGLLEVQYKCIYLISWEKTCKKIFPSSASTGERRTWCTGLSCTLGMLPHPHPPSPPGVKLPPGSLPPGGEDTLGYLAPHPGQLTSPGVKLPLGSLPPTPRKTDRT